MRLFSSREKEYRSPTGAIPFGTKMHLRIVLPRDLHCTGAVAIVKDDKFGDSDVYGMYWCGMVGDDHEQWECDVDVDNIGLYCSLSKIIGHFDFRIAQEQIQFPFLL